jgi:HlyD family secretion protein
MDPMQEITHYKSNTWKYKVAVFLSMLTLAFVLYYFFIHQEKKETYHYVTHTLKKEDVTLSVSATGYLQPLESVDVGIEVSGTVKEVLVDYNDIVKKAQALAILDKTKYLSNVNRAKASLAAAEATYENALAQFEMHASIITRDESLQNATDNRLPSQNDKESHQAAYLAAKAQVDNAKAQIDQAKYTLISAQYDLEKTVVYSPIDGIVLVRNIDPGQTVAASFQTPNLFTIAKDLTKMELQTDIDEADIAKIKQGQKATFNVDAYPDKIFKADVTSVRVNSQILDGVVTYKCIMHVSNPDLLLRPGMSADADIIIKSIENTFTVPKAALLYIPVETRESKLFSFQSKPEPPKDEKPHIWVLRQQRAQKVYVDILGNSGITTAIASDTLKADEKIILAQEIQE